MCVCVFSGFVVLCWYFGPFAFVICVWVCLFCHLCFLASSVYVCVCPGLLLCDLYVDVLLFALFRLLVFCL